jgi:release factor glutamine methyltransferase
MSAARETIADYLRHAASVLQAAGIEAPRREARILLAHALGTSASALSDTGRMVAAPDFPALLARRAAREPMALILGHQGFWTLDLEVSPATLIPRADSETLVEAALAAFPDRDAVRRVLDLGTGTGCLLLACLAEFPCAFGVGVDIRPEAAALAARNAARNGLAGRAAMLAGVWAAALAGQFDLVLCNPPYIPGGEIPALMPEVAAHEPRSALDGGADGLAAYRAIFPALRDLMTPGGVAICEIGAGQADEVSALARNAGFPPPDRRCDLGGVVRVLVVRRG